MAVTLLCDEGDSSPFRLSAYFQWNWGSEMQKDERDLLEDPKSLRLVPLWSQAAPSEGHQLEQGTLLVHMRPNPAAAPAKRGSL
jgi:hypothetical protein